MALVAGVALVAQITPLFVQRARIEVARPGEALHPDLQRPATKDTTNEVAAMTEEAREALEDITRAVAEASNATTAAERLRHLLDLAVCEVEVMAESGNPSELEWLP